VYHFQTRQPWDGGGRLTYGENPHQKSEFLPNRRLGPKFYKAFSFNNIRDAEAVIKFLRPFSGLNAACVVKHQTLCGAAVGIKSSDSAQVFEEAWEGDPTSRFGGVVGLNFTPSSEVVSTFEKKFIEVLVLPRNDQTEALAESLSKKKDKLKILLVSDNALKPDAKRRELVRGQLGELMQDSDSLTLESNADRDLQKLLKSFGEWCAACSKSNAIALVAGIDSKNLVTLAGAGQGQPNRIDSLERLALPRAIDFCARRSVSVNQLVCVSDAFLPFDDCIQSLAKAGVKRLIQPGGSKADEKVAATANQLGVSMELTGRRHFWH
jgi:phosphoribosylaminoimidazolecarboxamide formyltransferase/IMP cyclohydrolase